MYYPACDSSRGFIEVDMGLVGLLWCRTHVHVLNQIIKKQRHISVLCRVKIGVLMYYPACDSRRSFIEADMGLVGMLLDRSICVPHLKVQCHIPLSCVE